MTNQPDLYRPMCAEVSATQRELFERSSETALRCEAPGCGAYLVETPSGFVCCPKGHGKLIARDQAGDDAPLWDEEE